MTTFFHACLEHHNLILSAGIERLYALYTTIFYSPNLLDAGAEGSPLTAMAASSEGLMLICLRVKGLNLM